MTSEQNTQISERMDAVQTSIDELMQASAARFTAVEWADFCEIRSALIDLRAAVSIIHESLLP